MTSDAERESAEERRSGAVRMRGSETRTEPAPEVLRTAGDADYRRGREAAGARSTATATATGQAAASTLRQLHVREAVRRP